MPAVFGRALDFLLPPRCLACGREGNLLCPPCSAGFPRLEPPYCQVCADPGVTGVCRSCVQSEKPIAGIRAPYLMEGPVREAIHGFKYRDVRAAAPALARLLAEYLSANPLLGESIVPVPLHRRKLRERGYNQAALLARELGKLTGRPVAENLLSRTRATPPQVSTASQQQRAENMAGAFHCREQVDGHSFLLLDDVSTTGSTLTAAAAALKEAGATSVWGLALARESKAGIALPAEETLP